MAASSTRHVVAAIVLLNVDSTLGALLRGGRYRVSGFAFLRGAAARPVDDAVVVIGARLAGVPMNAVRCAVCMTAGAAAEERARYRLVVDLAGGAAAVAAPGEAWDLCKGGAGRQAIVALEVARSCHAANIGVLEE